MQIYDYFNKKKRELFHNIFHYFWKSYAIQILIEEDRRIERVLYINK